MRTLALCLCLTLLTGCATTEDGYRVGRDQLNVYSPVAASVNGLGYDALQTAPNRWRVWYTIADQRERRLAEQYALRHAAEIALEHGASWFRVHYDAAPTHSEDLRVASSDGTLTQSFERSAEPGPLSVVRNWVRRAGNQGQITAVLDIETGSGPRPGGTYDAIAIAGSYP